MQSRKSNPTTALWGAVTSLLVLLAPVALGQETTGTSETAPAPPPAPAEPSGFLAEYLAVQDSFSGKIIDLAKAIPADKYSWRPAEGVRSISEALMHVTGTNFYTAQSVGATLPPDLPADLSQVGDKAKVVELLERSFKLVRGLCLELVGVDLTQPVPEGPGTSYAGALLGFAQHHGEHLGQLIAYSRSVGVVPPWSRSQP